MRVVPATRRSGRDCPILCGKCLRHVLLPYGQSLIKEAGEREISGVNSGHEHRPLPGLPSADTSRQLRTGHNQPELISCHRRPVPTARRGPIRAEEHPAPADTSSRDLISGAIAKLWNSLRSRGRRCVSGARPNRLEPRTTRSTQVDDLACARMHANAAPKFR